LRTDGVTGDVRRDNLSDKEQNLSTGRFLTDRPAERARGTRVSRMARSAAAAHSLTRALESVSGVGNIGACVLRHARRAIGCRFASMAAPTGDGELAIVAVAGYPHEFVRGLRIPVGQGPIGRVFESGRPMVVPDLSAIPQMPSPRPRFATNSFMAVPLKVGAQVVGIVCLSDPLDGRPFAAHHLRILRRAIAPASLAFALDASRCEARASERAAMIDPVTGLFNRRYFELRFEEELQRASRNAARVGLLMIDIDDFKTINDRFGHPVGDTVLRDVADVLRGSVRRFDVCARFGGDEFAVIMADADEQRLENMAERIRGNIDRYRPETPGVASPAITVSIGTTVATGRRPHDVVERADHALYAAKHAGKNRVVGATLMKSSPAPDFPAALSQLRAV
jgi:diguanylate cyclase (GGDEF)-like protein